MSIILDAWNGFKNWGAVLTGKINWTTKRVMSQEDLDLVKSKLIDNYYVIATRHNGHFSSYVIAFAHLILTGKWGYYGHVLMNLEDHAEADGDFKFIEAVGEGVRITGFSNALDDQTGSVALLKPKNMSLEDWTLALDKAKSENGKPYDTVFDLANDKALSCVEVIRVALQATPDYDTNFAEFERMIKKSKNLDPQFFYECSDFEVVWEVRH
jgi:hypothetical protein